MSNNFYSTIENTAVEATSMLSNEISVPRTTELKAFVGKSKDKLIIGSVIAFFVIAGAFLMNGYSNGSDLSASLYQSEHSRSHSSSKKHHHRHHYLPPLCTFEECNAALCDVDTAPYTCVKNNGGPHGGCSPRPWTKGTCDHQCDLSDCAFVRIPTNEASCKYVQCDKAWCSSNNTVRCPDAAPYQCLEGSAKFGCTTEMDLWGFQTPNTTCSKCCDTVTCEDDEY